jgi:hypothetical protein
LDFAVVLRQKGNARAREGALSMRAWHARALAWLRGHGLQGLASSAGGRLAAGGPGEGVAAQDVVRIGVLGLSGIGKSSLLNALLTPGVQLLPAGGVGPLTGASVRLVPREEVLLRATYHSRSWVGDLLDEVRSDAEGSHLPARFTAWGPRAADPTWLARVLEHVLDPEAALLPECPAPLAEALAVLAGALASPAPVAVIRRDEAPARFHRLVRAHVAGALTPFCDELKLGCDAPLLAEGIELVDLPGLGTFGDESAGRTLQVLEQLRGVVLVLDRSGVPDVVMTALARSGFLRRWIAGEASGVIAVTKLDEIASSARDAATIRQRWPEHLREVREEAREIIYQQVRCAFAAAGGAQAERLLAEPERVVFPVTSHELEALHRADGTARVRLAEATGIPELRRAVLALARTQAVRWAPAVTRRLRDPSAERSPGRELYSEWLTLLDEVCS